MVGYVEAFLSRMAHAGPLSPLQQVQLFTGGLPDPIRTDVELQAPTDLQRAMGLERAYERRAAALTGAGTVRVQRPTPRPQPLPLPSPLIASPTPAPATTTIQAPPRPLRRLSPAEMAERRRQGLCFNCDKQYVRGHKCQRLFYLEVTDDDDTDLPEETAHQEVPPPLISLHAITGIRLADTMQIRVAIGPHVLTALLDSGSTQNFVSEVAAHKVGLRFDDSSGARVTVANGDRVTCRGVARNVVIRIDDDHFQVDCYAIPLDCYDLVLGV